MKQWEHDIRASWDVSFTGMSALDAALQRNYHTEVGSLLGNAVAVTLWDLEKFF